MRTKIVSVSTFTIATLYALYSTGSFSWLLFALMAAAVLMVDMGTTAFNIYFDYRSGVDHLAYQREEDKVLVYENVAPGAAFLVAAGLFFGAVVVGLIISILTSWYVAFAGALCMAVGFFYTGGPRPISRTPFGEFFAGGFLGSALFLITYFVLAGHRPEVPDLSLEVFLASLPSFFLIASILTVNNTCDIEGDKDAGRRTFSIIFGKKIGELTVYLLGLAGFGSAILFGLIGVFPPAVSITVAAAALPAVFVYHGFHTQGLNQETKIPSMGRISKIFMLYTLAMWIGLISSQFPVISFQ